jgi:hypothetical protein
MAGNCTVDEKPIPLLVGECTTLFSICCYTIFLVKTNHLAYKFDAELALSIDA